MPQIFRILRNNSCETTLVSFNTFLNPEQFALSEIEAMLSEKHWVLNISSWCCWSGELEMWVVLDSGGKHVTFYNPGISAGNVRISSKTIYTFKNISKNWYQAFLKILPILTWSTWAAGMYESRGRKRPNVAIKNSPLLCSVVDQLVKYWEF